MDIVSASIGIVVLGLWAADVGTKASSAQPVVNSGACPTPDEGSFRPHGDVTGAFVRKILLPDDGVTTILHVVVIPGYGPVHALRFETPDGVPGKPARPRLRSGLDRIM